LVSWELGPIAPSRSISLRIDGDVITPLITSIVLLVIAMEPTPLSLMLRRPKAHIRLSLSPRSSALPSQLPLPRERNTVKATGVFLSEHR
jgi:hypothetical protein